MNAAVEELNLILPELRRELARCLGDELVGLYLYGSYARGEQTSDSDIDVLVVVRDASKRPELWDRTLNAVAGICLKYDTLISDVIVSEERFRNEQSPLLISVRREGVPL